jgi:hypothetical protein
MDPDRGVSDGDRARRVTGERGPVANARVTRTPSSSRLGAIPADSPVVGHTWWKANKDGSPDRRFKGNFRIPIVQYGMLTLKSPTGLNEAYLISNAPVLRQKRSDVTLGALDTSQSLRIQSRT